MKIYLIILVLFIFASCRDDIIKVEPKEEFVGTLSVQSAPSGALILLNNVNTNKFTPNILEDLEPGTYPVTLKLGGYADTTIIKTVNANVNSFLSVNLIKE